MSAACGHESGARAGLTAREGVGVCAVASTSPCCGGRGARARSVAATYKPPMRVPRAQLPACACLQWTTPATDLRIIICQVVTICTIMSLQSTCLIWVVHPHACGDVLSSSTAPSPSSNGHRMISHPSMRKSPEPFVVAPRCLVNMRRPAGVSAPRPEHQCRPWCNVSRSSQRDASMSACSAPTTHVPAACEHVWHVLTPSQDRTGDLQRVRLTS